MIARMLPITQVKPELKDAVRMSVAEIERFLAMFYPIDVIRQHQSALAIAGQWLARVKGFHDDDDFLHLVRDFLSWVLSGGERSLASDQISFLFSGFMPSYGTARTFLGIVNDGGTWPDVRAFMHSQAYGNAKRHVEEFDWSGGGKKAQAEAQAWLDVLKVEDERLQTATRAGSVLLAQALPQPNGPLTDFPANDSYFPKPRPPLRVVPPIEAPVVGEGVAAEAAAANAVRATLTEILAGIFSLPVIVGIGLLVYSPDAGDPEAERRMLAQQQAEARRRRLAIPDPQVKTAVQVDAQTQECKRQTETNKQNGAKCENDGYVLMEKSLGYQRLVDPPKGRGLDGLFEKQADMNAPNPMPKIVTEPAPGGILLFIPEATKPPTLQYKALNPHARSLVAYPLFVVFEAKHVSKAFDPSDAEGIKKEAKRRLGETCDGTQMSEPWTEARIPQALNRSVKNKGMTPDEADKKITAIRAAGYARWMFICLPGPTGSGLKLFVLIDVVTSGMDLDQKHVTPEPEPSRPDGSTF